MCASYEKCTRQDVPAHPLTMPKVYEGRSRSVADRSQTATKVRGERRWPVVLAVVISMLLLIAQPHHVFPIMRWLIPAIEGVLLIVIIAMDPGRIDSRSTSARRFEIGLVIVMVSAALYGTAILIHDLVYGSSVTDAAASLLKAGGNVWLGNVVAFSLLYWELDSGGPGVRAHHMPGSPGFAFPQQLNPEVAPPSWRPRYVDYFYLSFTSATAFSPTDAMPLVPWAKLSMALESLISLLILGLVVARAVNIFS